MVSSNSFPLLLVVLLTFIFLSHSTFLLPILKDPSKPQYYTTFPLGTPPFRVSLSIDLSNPWSWFTCHLVGFSNEPFYHPVPNSSTYARVPCSSSAFCSASYGSLFCYDCDYSTCSAGKGQSCGAENYGPYYYSHDVNGREVAPLLLDRITIYRSSGQGSDTLSPVLLNKFPFSCAYKSELKGLSQYTKGVLSLARKESSIHGLISKTFKVPHKFALCLPSSASRGGTVGLGL